jgi:hypothetical protein
LAIRNLSIDPVGGPDTVTAAFLFQYRQHPPKRFGCSKRTTTDSSDSQITRTAFPQVSGNGRN